MPAEWRARWRTPSTGPPAATMPASPANEPGIPGSGAVRLNDFLSSPRSPFFLPETATARPSARPRPRRPLRPPGGRGAAWAQRVQHAMGTEGAGQSHGGGGRWGRGAGGRHGVLRRQRRQPARPTAGAPARVSRGVPGQPPRDLRQLEE